MTEKPVLPPTPTRSRLFRDIKAGLVECWHFINGPEIHRTYDDRLVTARVAELERLGMADRGKPTYVSQRTKVRLTPAGEEWLKTYGGTE